MTPLRPHELRSPLLRLPPEVRVHIYSYLLPGSGLDIDLCTHRRSETSSGFSRNGRQRRSPVSNLLRQRFVLEDINRVNGLHLLLVCRRTRSEILPSLADTLIRFHCPRCYMQLIPNNSCGLGVGIDWIKHVEIVVDPMDQNQVAWRRPGTLVGTMSYNLEIGRTMAREAMQSCMRLTWNFRGRLDLMGKEKWKYEPLREANAGIEEDGPVREYIAQLPMSQNGMGQHQHQREVPKRWLIKGDFDI